MIKTTLYGAVAAGALAVAVTAGPATAAPVAKMAPQVQSNVTDVQYYYYYDGPRYRHRHWRHRGHYYDGYHSYGVHVWPGVGVRAYHW